MNKATIRLLKNLSTGLVILAMSFAFLISGIRIFGVQVYGVLSGSMEPTHPTGSLIYVKKTDVSDLRVNDVITFSVSPNVIVTHRIVEIVQDEDNPSVVRYRTKGDANKDVDASLVSANNIIGKVMFSVPQMGYIANFIQQPPGIYVAIFVCALTIAFVFYTDSLENKQKEASHRGARDEYAARNRRQPPQTARQNQYARQDAYSRQGSYPERNGYSRQREYNQRGEYARRSEYPREEGYSRQSRYQQQGGYVQRSEYPREEGYSRQSRYQQQGGYAQRSEYPREEGYSRQGRYQQQGGYAQRSGYPREDGCARQSGYQQQRRYAQQEDYSRQSAYPQRSGYAKQGGNSHQSVYRDMNEYSQRRAHPQTKDEVQEREYYRSRDGRS